MSASWDLQALIVARLEADATVAGLVTGVYDGRPSTSDFPCITIGPSDLQPDDADCIDGREETLQLDIWSRDKGRLNPCKIIVDSVYAALHDWDGVLPDPNALASLMVEQARVFIDEDGITAHGVVVVTAKVETA